MRDKASRVIDLTGMPWWGPLLIGSVIVFYPVGIFYTVMALAGHLAFR